MSADDRARILAVQVKPGSAKGPLVVAQEDGSLVVFLRERAVEGAANLALVALVASHLGVPRSAVTIRHGHRGRRKLLAILGESRPAEGPNRAALGPGRPARTQ